MRLLLFFSVVFLFLSLSMAFADQHVSITLSRYVHASGETVQAEISLSNPARELTSKQIKVRDASGVVVNVAPFLLQLHDQYFLYFDLPEILQEGAYTLSLENVPFVVNGTLIEETHTVEFSVEAHQPILAVRPGGLVITDDLEEFQLRVVNLQQTTNVTLHSPEWITHPYSSEQIINEGTTRLLKFTIDQTHLPPVDTVEHLSLSYDRYTYDIPLYYYHTTTARDDGSALEILNGVTFINRTLRQDQTLQGIILVSNPRTTPVSLTLSVSGPVASLVSATLDTSSLDPHQNATLNVLINPLRTGAPGTYEGKITLGSGTSSLTIPLAITLYSQSQQLLIANGTESGKPADTQTTQDFRILDSFNYTQPTGGTTKKSGNVGLIITILLLLLVAVLYYISRKKVTTTKGFDEYIQGIEKKR